MSEPGNTVQPKNVNGGSGEGSWCTPKWIADLLGGVDLDPCSNPRSHIRARHKRTLENGDDGCPAGTDARTHIRQVRPGYKHQDQADVRASVFVNCPYNRGEVVKWVRHWRSTRFTFLLKWAPDTKWFGELIGHCTHLWFPVGQRIEFEPPPGVKASSNPFPHAIYMREPPEDRLRRLSTKGLVLEVTGAYLDNFRGAVDII